MIPSSTHGSTFELKGSNDLPTVLKTSLKKVAFFHDANVLRNESTTPPARSNNFIKAYLQVLAQCDSISFIVNRVSSMLFSTALPKEKFPKLLKSTTYHGR